MTREYPAHMKGAIAAGHPLTADAGARVLAAGGNAVDAAVAAALVSWVAESPLTGPGAGGFMLVHRARDSTTRVFDFFVAVPGMGLAHPELAESDSRPATGSCNTISPRRSSCSPSTARKSSMQASLPPRSPTTCRHMGAA